MQSEHSITDLLPALMNGESAAVEIVWDRFFTNLCRVAHNRLASARVRAADEEDVAASAIASVCRRLERREYVELHNRDELRRLLVTVTARKARTLIRNETRRKRGGGKVSGESVFRSLGSSMGQGIDAIASAEPSPEFIVETTETIEKLFCALDEQERQVAMLKLEGYRNDEIADKIDRATVTVERKLKRIREKWTELIEATDDASRN